MLELIKSKVYTRHKGTLVASIRDTTKFSSAYDRYGRIVVIRTYLEAERETRMRQFEKAYQNKAITR